MEKLLAAYLAAKLPSDGGVTITDLLRIPGGASRETWMCHAAWERSGEAFGQEFVVRVDPPASLVESDRAVEYAFYSAFEGSGVPVPRMRWLENDIAHLGAPFFIMEKIPGCDSSPRRIQEAAYDDSRLELGRQMYDILGRIHRHEWRPTTIPGVVSPPLPGECWQRELAYWEGMIDRNELSPQPVARAAIRWLRANPPPAPLQVSVVHGDYRVGNFLYTPNGIEGIVDWEMAHLGDPLEDLAWSFMEYWEWGIPGKKGGIIAIDDAIAAYEASSGLTVDRDALHWWDVFSGVKGQGIWLTGARSFDDGRSKELMLAYTAYTLTNTQDEILLRSLGRGA